MLILANNAFAACSNSLPSMSSGFPSCSGTGGTTIDCSGYPEWTGTTTTKVESTTITSIGDCTVAGGMWWSPDGIVDICVYCQTCTISDMCSAGDRIKDLSLEFGTNLNVAYCGQSYYDSTGSPCATGNSFLKTCCNGAVAKRIPDWPQNPDDSWPAECYLGSTSYYDPTDPAQSNYIVWTGNACPSMITCGNAATCGAGSGDPESGEACDLGGGSGSRYCGGDSSSCGPDRQDICSNNCQTYTPKSEMDNCDAFQNSLLPGDQCTSYCNAAGDVVKRDCYMTSTGACTCDEILQQDCSCGCSAGSCSSCASVDLVALDVWISSGGITITSPVAGTTYTIVFRHRVDSTSGVDYTDQVTSNGAVISGCSGLRTNRVGQHDTICTYAWPSGAVTLAASLTASGFVESNTANNQVSKDYGSGSSCASGSCGNCGTNGACWGAGSSCYWCSSLSCGSTSCACTFTSSDSACGGGGCLANQRFRTYTRQYGNSLCSQAGTCVNSASCAASCSGTLGLTLNPSSVAPSGTFSFSGSGLSGCDGKTIHFDRSTNCGSPEASCTVSGSGCSASGAAPSTANTYTYRACVDKNNLNGYGDVGEQATASLTVTLSGATACETECMNLGYITGSCTNSCVSTDIAGMFKFGCSSNICCCSNPPPPPPPSVCGNGIWESDEDCDDGASNGFCPSASCSTSCTLNDCCSGVVLGLVPSTVSPSTTFNVEVNDTGNCEGRGVYFKNTSSCSTSGLTSCTISGSTCASSLVSPSLVGNTTYYACININTPFAPTWRRDSKVLSVINPCSGNVDLSFIPNPTVAASGVEPTITGLVNCRNRNVNIYSGSYGSAVSCVNPSAAPVANCSTGDVGTGCNANMFTSPSLLGTYTYVACVDKDYDGMFANPGEYENENLDVTPPCTGTIQLTLNPSEVPTLNYSTPTAWNLTNCASKPIVFKKSSSCATGSALTACNGSTGCTGAPIQAGGVAGTETFAACIDKNSNGNYNDAGEQGFAQLTVTSCAQTPSCNSCQNLINGQPCDCGAECNSNLCDAGVCKGCLSDEDCVSPPSACHDAGICVAGICSYPLRTNNRVDCCTCSSGSECQSGVCNGGRCGSGSCGPETCTNNLPLDDCGSSECPACVLGTAQTYTGAAVPNTVVEMDAQLLAVTDSQGFYYNKNNPVGSHEFSISPSQPWTTTTITKVLQKGINIVNLIVGIGFNNCESDCTLIGSSYCVASCQGTNGCSFPNSEAQYVCNEMQAGFIRNVNMTHQVVCCEGELYQSPSIQAVAYVNSTTVSTITRTVFYAGKLVKMKIIVFK